MTSEQLFEQLQQYNPGQAPSLIEKTIKDAYAGPVGQLIERGNQLRQEAYPAFFKAFEGIGTGAADMSPAAALAAAMGQSELAMSPYRNNMDLRNYYNTSINDMVGKGLQSYEAGYNSLRDLYQMAEDKRRFQEQMNEARAARASRGGGGAGSAGFGGFDLSTKLQEIEARGDINQATKNAMKNAVMKAAQSIPRGQTQGATSTSAPRSGGLMGGLVDSLYGGLYGRRPFGGGWRKTVQRASNFY